MSRRFSMYENPTASARPSAWLAIPALPSCKTQTAGEGLLLVSNAVGTAGIERIAMRRFKKGICPEQEGNAVSNKIAQTRRRFYYPRTEREGFGCGASDLTISIAASCGTC